MPYPALSDTTPRGTRGGVARTGLRSAVPLCGTGAIMVRVYRQPDERLSTQRPERLTRTFNYTRCRPSRGCFRRILGIAHARSASRHRQELSIYNVSHASEA